MARASGRNMGSVTMADDLSEFVDVDETRTTHAGERRDNSVRDVFLFEYEGDKYAVSASQVVGVIPWQNPVPLPRSDPRVWGVLQDRGRIVVLLAHPRAEPQASHTRKAARIVVCSTDRGYVGLPATATLSVGPVQFPDEPHPLETVDSSAGALTYLDPSQYIER